MLPAVHYKRLFLQNDSGKLVLEELKKFFHYDVTTYAEDPYATMFNEGQRSVLLYILGRISEKPRKQEKEALDE